MLDFLHITNGDSAAEIIKQSPVPGDVLPWRDTMHYGPFPGKLDLEALSQVRAAYFAEDSPKERPAIEQDFKKRDQQLHTARQYQEVVLWYEHDLLDQLQILQLLDWFGQNRDTLKRLSLICINQFAGINPFIGIGQLSGEQMASLFEDRLPITEAQINLATKGWAAFRSPTPEKLITFIDTNDCSPLPFLHAALTRHLQENPYSSDGLTRTERQLLTLISNGIQNPALLFKENMQLEDALYIGDWATHRIIGELCNSPHPLISCEPNTSFRYPPADDITLDEFSQQQLKITTLGKQVLSQEVNALDFIKRDYWLGGVHIHSNQSMWLWDKPKKIMILKG